MSVEVSPVPVSATDGHGAVAVESQVEVQGLVRHGAVSEVVRARCTPVGDGGLWQRGEDVVLETPRGPFVGTFLEQLAARHAVASAEDGGFRILRRVGAEDRAMLVELRASAREEYARWSARIREWGLALELLDTEWALDRSCLVLYILGGRGAETTRLALNAVGIGCEYVAVQPVDANGPVPVEAAGGSCGSGGSCGCG
jgi:hypothetical protein